jgi:hypothetical protein
MFYDDIYRCWTVKWTVSTEPLVDENTKRILVRRRTRVRVTLKYLWCRVQKSFYFYLWSYRDWTRRSFCNIEIAHEYLTNCADQLIFRFEIAMDEFVVMYILQCSSSLFDIRNNGYQWYGTSLRMPVSQRPVCCILHNNIWQQVNLSKIFQLNDVWMPERRDECCLLRYCLGPLE